MPVSFCSSTVSRHNPFPIPWSPMSRSFWRIEAALGFEPERQGALERSDAVHGQKDAAAATVFGDSIRTIDLDTKEPNAIASQADVENLTAPALRALACSENPRAALANLIRRQLGTPSP